MIVSPGSKGMSRPSSLKVGMANHLARGSSRARNTLSIALAADHVHGAKGRNDVSDHFTAEKHLRSLEVDERRRTATHAVRRPAAIGHDVEAELAVAAFGVRVDLAGRRLHALHDEL